MALAVAPLLPGSARATPFTPVADSYVDESAPTTNFGTSISFRTDGSPILTAYLRFNVQGVGPTDTVTLRVFAETANSLGFRVHSVSDNTWSETALDDTNAPSFGPVVDSSGPVLAGTWSSVDVSSIVPGDGPVSFALTSESATATRFSSREGTNPPELIIGGSSSAPSSYLVTREGDTYRATPDAGTTYTGTLKQVLQSAVQDLHSAGGGTVTFTTGVFDFGSERFEGNNFLNITFQGQGMDVTVLQNNSSAAADTEPFDMGGDSRITIRDMTVNAGGPFRSTSDAMDFDGGNDVVIERVKITVSRGRGIVFDGKDIIGGAPRTANHNVVRDCVITGAGVQSDGIELLASSDNRIEGCTITDVGGHGIQMTKSSTMADQPNKKSSGNVISGNHVENSGQDGINVTAGDRNEILENTVLNSSNITSGRDGIRITSADSINCDDNVVSGNTSGDNQATKTQRYGLHIASSLCNRTVVGDNTFFGNQSGAIRDVGTNTQYTGGSDNQPPTPPGNLTAVAVSSNRVDLAWTASTDNVGVTGYEIFRNGALLTTVGTVTTYSDLTVAPSTTYQYQVRARDAVGNLSAFSNTATVTTPAGIAAPVFSDDFETGNLSRWTANTGLIAQQQEVYAGSWAARATSTGAARWAYKQFGSTYTELYYRVRFKFLSQGSARVYVLKFRTGSGASILGLYRAGNGTLGYRNDVAAVGATSSTPVSLGAWHEVQVRVRINGTSGETETWLDGVRIAALSKTENFGTTPIGRIQIGENASASSGIAYDVAFDDVVANTSFIA